MDSRDRTIPDSAVQAIQRARAAGHLVYVNSGRPWCGVDPRVKAMGFHGFVCGCGLYIREGEEVLFHRRLSTEVQLRAVDLVRRHGLQVMYEGADHVYFDLTRPLAPQVAAEKDYYDRMGLDTEGDPAGPDAAFDKFVVWTGPGFDLAAFRREVEGEFDLILREGTLIELVSHGCSKGIAMGFLLERHGLGRENCVAIGDSGSSRRVDLYLKSASVKSRGRGTIEGAAGTAFQPPPGLGSLRYFELWHVAAA